MIMKRILLILCISALLAVQASAAPGKNAQESPFAICALSVMFGREHPDWDAWAKEAAALKDVGIYWSRFDFWWSVVEPEKDKFDWSFTDKVARFFRDQKMNGMPILCYSSAWYKKPPDNDEERARYANYVYQVVKRYKDTYHVYEIWNEPNIPTFWSQPNVRDYTLMLIAAYNAAKKADPTCTILAGATSGPDLTFIKGIHDNGGWDCCDGISIHPYSMAGSAVEMRLDKILRVMNWYIASTGKPKTLWTTEMGWTTQNPREEKQQAISMFQSYVISMANGMTRVFWFCFTDWGENWGIVRSIHPLKPKMAYGVYKLMTEHFGSPGPAAEFEGYLKMPEGAAGYVFKKPDGSRMLVFWSNDRKYHSVQIPQKTGLSGVDIFGKRVMIANGRLTFGATPVIVTGAEAGEIGEVGMAFDPFIEPKGKNLITNPSIDAAGKDYPDAWHWGRFHHRDKDAVYETSSEGRGGSTCVSVSKSGNSGAWDNRLMPVFPGAKYRMTGWIKTKDATGNNCLSLEWYSGNQWTRLGDARTKTITGTHDWTKVNIEGTVPDNVIFVRPALISENNSGTAWFDDIEVVEE